jgi:hypothetical protein
MASVTGNRPADPLAKGTLATAKQAWSDLFKWDQRVVVRNEYGEETCEWQKPEPLKNPISLLAQLGFKDWLYFLVGFFAWTADAFDFHALSIQTTKLAAYFERSNTSISTAITLTLLLRSVGAAFFGLAGDKFGRKWPMVLNMIILGLLQVATIYCATFNQFLAVRALFGLFMGGVYGNAIAMALENCPVNARGLMSGKSLPLPLSEQIADFSRYPPARLQFRICPCCLRQLGCWWQHKLLEDSVLDRRRIQYPCRSRSHRLP